MFSARRASYPEPDGELTFDKLGSVFLSGNATRDDAPNHVRIQRHVPREVAQTWVSMCPAAVYEIPEAQLENEPPSTSTSSPPTASSAARSRPRAAG